MARVLFIAAIIFTALYAVSDYAERHDMGPVCSTAEGVCL
jgi:hypothetical protein